MRGRVWCLPIARRSAEEYPGATWEAPLCAPTVTTHVSCGGLHQPVVFMCTRAQYAVAISGVISSDIGYCDVFVAQEGVRCFKLDEYEQPSSNHSSILRGNLEQA